MSYKFDKAKKAFDESCKESFFSFTEGNSVSYVFTGKGTIRLALIHDIVSEMLVASTTMPENTHHLFTDMCAQAGIKPRNRYYQNIDSTIDQLIIESI